MLFHDSIIIQAKPNQIFQFFEKMHLNYTKWHPEHIMFRWVKGSGVKVGSVFYFEERIGGELLKKRVVFTKVIPDQYMEFVPTNWFYRLFMPRFSFEMQSIDDQKTRFIAEFIVQGMGPLAKWLNRKQLEAVRIHMQEEGENLKKIMEMPKQPSQHS